MAKFSEIQIDSELSWSAQTENLKNKLCRTFAVFKKVKPLLHREALFRLHASICHSHLCYCAELWDNCSKVLYYQLMKHQKGC